MGKSKQKRVVGGGRNGVVDNGEGDYTIVVDKDFKANAEAGVSIPKNGGGLVGAMDTDKIALRVGRRNIPGGVESASGTGEGRRALW